MPPHTEAETELITAARKYVGQELAQSSLSPGGITRAAIAYARTQGLVDSKANADVEALEQEIHRLRAKTADMAVRLDKAEQLNLQHAANLTIVTKERDDARENLQLYRDGRCVSDVAAQRIIDSTKRQLAGENAVPGPYEGPVNNEGPDDSRLRKELEAAYNTISDLATRLSAKLGGW